MDLNKELAELKAKITPMSTAKFLAGTVASLGATAAVIALMKSGLSGSRGITKLLMKLGIFVLACKAGEVAKDYLEEYVTEMEDAYHEMQNEAKEAGSNA